MSSGLSGLHDDCLKKQTWGPVRWVIWCLPLKSEHQSSFPGSHIEMGDSTTWSFDLSMYSEVCVCASQRSHIHNNNNKLKRLTLPWSCEIQAYTEFFQSGAHMDTPTHLLSLG